jgi:regulator of protease activity HflC (stomatin/prohibitin superfamily)
LDRTNIMKGGEAIMQLRVRIREFEVGLRFDHGRFVRMLGPGSYWCLTPWRTRIEKVNQIETRFDHDRLDVLLQNEAVRAALQIVDLTDNQRALLWKDKRLAAILGPGRHAFWNKPHKLEVEVFDVNDLYFKHRAAEVISRHSDAQRFLKRVDIEAHEQVLVFKNGELIDTLGQGAYLFWANAASLRFQKIDLREQVLDVAGQEIMTSDKVTLRLNLVVSYKVADAIKVLTAVSDYTQALYRESQLALRAAIGTRSLDQLLADKESVSGQVGEAVTERAAEFGVSLLSVGLRDIILPGDMKLILNEVIAAQKQAEANLIKRREETAAARSQANTARLLADNPVLARIKELELIQEILAGSNATFVFGNADIVDQVRRLTHEPTGPSH